MSDGWSDGMRAARPGRLAGRVAASEQMGSLVWLTLDVPGWPGARPGQFVLLQPEPSRCFLARALSVAAEVGERVSFLIAPVGEGTRELSELAPGGEVRVVGPLGNGFDLAAALADTAGQGRVLLVAGGVGVAPFPLLIRQLGRFAAAVANEVLSTGSSETRFPEVVVLLGFRDSVQAQAKTAVSQAVSEACEAGLRCRVAVVAEDGSGGPPGKLTDLLARELRPGDRLLVCGPAAMSVAVWQACRTVADVQAWFSLEAGMACGVGSCHGCVLTLADGSMARVCRDGPVFAGERVFGRDGLPPEGAQRLGVRS